MFSENTKRLIERGERLRSSRRTLESVWQDVEYYYGGIGGITEERAPGQERDPLADATTVHAWKGFALSLGGLLRPRGQKWIKPKFTDDELNDNDNVKMWREIVGDRMMGAINATETRSITSLRQTDESITLFGVAFLFLDENVKKSRLRFRSFHPRDCYLDVDSQGTVDTVYRYFRLTAAQAAQEFGKENLHKEVQDALHQGSDKKWKFVHITLPADYVHAKDIKTNMPVASTYLDCDNQHTVSDAGFLEMPWIVPRDGVPAGWMYGYSMCMANLPDARNIQQIAHAIADASEYTLSPPLLANDAAVTGEISLGPDGITYYDPTRLSGNRPAIERLDISGNLPVGLQEQQEKRQSLFNGFMRDVLNLPLNSGMSVPEIIRRNEDMARMIAPMTDPLLNDYNGAIGDRVFGIMLRAQQFPGGSQGPVELQGMRLVFEYENPISRIEAETELMRIKQAVAEAIEMAGVDPTVLDEIDLPRLARRNLIDSGAYEFLRDPQEVARLRQQRQEQAAQEALPGQVQQGADAAIAAAEAMQVVQQ